MNHQDDDLGRRLEAWLAETARPMPSELFDDIVRGAPRFARAGIRAEFPSGRPWRLALGALAAMLLLAIGLGVAWRPRVEPDAGGNGSAAPPSAVGPSLGPEGTPAATPGSSPGTSAAVPSSGAWHRNNYGSGEERLTCTETTVSWTCNYQVPDGSGWFSGQDVTSTWACPSWFPGAICDDVVAVYHGTLVLLPPDGQTPGPSSVVSQDYVITEVDGRKVLQLYWVDQFVCPWYRTSEEALAEEFVCWFAP